MLQPETHLAHVQELAALYEQQRTAIEAAAMHAERIAANGYSYTASLIKSRCKRDLDALQRKSQALQPQLLAAQCWLKANQRTKNNEQCSPFAVRRSPFAVRRSPFAVRLPLQV